MSFTIFLLGISLTTAAAIITSPPSGVDYLADPNDCTKFYQCFYGTIHHYTCNPGHYFDPITKFCLYFGNMTCDDITEAPTFSTPGTLHGTSSHSTQTFPFSTESSPESTTESPYIKTACTESSTGVPDCSKIFNGFFPNPYDCQSYFICMGGIPVLRYCLPEYNWNWKIDACEPEDGVDCSYISTYEPSPTTTPEPTTREPTTTGGNPGVTCPDTPGTTYIAHPYDCAYFYECLNGGITLIRCPEGYFWSKERNMCDLESEVDCSYTSASPETTEPTRKTNPTTHTVKTTTEKTTTQGVETTTTEKTTTEGVETTTTENRCRGQPEGTFFPVLDDCTKFVVCDKGKEKIEECRSGTIWDEIYLTCIMGSC